MSQFITTVLAVQTAHGVRGRDAIYRISYYWQRLGGFGALGGHAAFVASSLVPRFTHTPEDHWINNQPHLEEPWPV